MIDKLNKFVRKITPGILIYLAVYTIWFLIHSYNTSTSLFDTIYQTLCIFIVFCGVLYANRDKQQSE
jgi:dolichyl-phosphate-mannose--protein O-mannosyl transferase